MPYCQHCGKKLEEGQTCTCELAQAAAEQPPQVEQAPPQQATASTAPAAENPVSIVLKKFKRYIASYISNPTQAVRSVMAEEYDFTLPIVLSVVRLLVMGLAIYGLLNKICKVMFSYITTSFLRYGNSTALLTASLTASLPKCLIFGALIAVIGMLLFLAMLYALVKIQQGEASFSEIFKASAANGVPTSALLLLSFLFSFISPTPAMVLIGLAMLCWIISGVRTAQIVSPNNSTGTFALLYFVGVALVIVVGYLIIPTLFRQAVGGITASYMGQSIALQDIFNKMSESFKSEFAEEGIRSMGDFFNMAMKQFFEEFSSELWSEIVSMVK